MISLAEPAREPYTPETPSPKPETRNPKSETRNPKSETRQEEAAAHLPPGARAHALEKGVRFRGRVKGEGCRPPP